MTKTRFIVWATKQKLTKFSLSRTNSFIFVNTCPLAQAFDCAVYSETYTKHGKLIPLPEWAKIFVVKFDAQNLNSYTGKDVLDILKSV